MVESCAPPALTFVGHSTVIVEMDGIRIITDPVLRDRTAHLRRHSSSPDPSIYGNVDAVLISHLHLDHCDFPSLRRLGMHRRLLVPEGAGRAFRRRGFRDTEELAPGDSTEVGSITVTATEAAHSGFRPPLGPRAIPLGFVIAGAQRIHFAGDTDLFPGMRRLHGSIDVALLPVWGWGRSIGPGHLDPERAARALALIGAPIAIPIHWGTLGTMAVSRPDSPHLADPPYLFARVAAELAPEVVVRILKPGECVGFGRSRGQLR
ncbi:MAG TPA: MBL fold metallo-hydrolase [Chloroflexota bacterium]